MVSIGYNGTTTRKWLLGCTARVYKKSGTLRPGFLFQHNKSGVTTPQTFTHCDNTLCIHYTYNISLIKAIS